LAGALAELSVHIARSGLLLAAAGAFALLAVTARGPLGIARLCGPRLHGALDIAVAVAMAAAPILPAFRPDTTGILVVEVTALAWIRLATLTRYTRPAPGSPPSTVASPTTVASSDAPVVPPPPGAVVARGLGLLAGRSARRLPNADEKLRAGARQAGRHAARLRAWRKPSS
jgi:hypothetical protein